MTEYVHEYVNVKDDETFETVKVKYNFKVKERDSKIGVMIVGLGGNNGTTFTAGVLAKQRDLLWETKEGIHEVEFLGSLSQFGSVHIGYKKNGKPYTRLYKDMIDLFDVEDVVVSGWDICGDDLYRATVNNQVIDFDLREKLKSDLQNIKPLKSVYYPNFIASNQEERADNVLSSASKWTNLNNIVKDIDDFKYANHLSRVVVLWSASTERFSTGIWNTKEELIEAIDKNDPEISPSIIFAVASCITGSIFLNGSPQNSLSPVLHDIARDYGAFIGGEDMKTGQTKIKSVLADFLVSSGIRPLSIVSYNHLGNNDGKNLDEYLQFRSKEVTKKSVIDDIVESNPVLFPEGGPDHAVVIKYVPAVGDSKRAMDEYYSELFLNGKQTIAIHNTCEDSLLAVPLMLDLILFSEFFSRVLISKNDEEYKSFSNTLSILSFFFKQPYINEGEPLINSFFNQKYGLENFVRILNGIPPMDFVNLHYRL
jgi:myo-inositol-1-phosphate synthase